MPTFNENLLVLVDRIEAIEGVVQVRFNKVLKSKFIDLVGEDGYNITSFVPSRTVDDRFVRFTTFVSYDMYNDLSAHDGVVADIQGRITNYVVNNIRPEPL
jgi:hypothetical protein